jgi:RimJ/RimL family protein N-acetyltransferase
LNATVLPTLRTRRLLLRPAVAADAPALHARRNHPEVARYQTWTLPYSLEQAEALIAEESADRSGRDGWWMLTVEHLETGEVIGDLALGFTWQGRCAEVGYTLSYEHWGHGYATEAIEALVAHLFEQVGVSRVMGMLHPDNRASAMVLERTGFVFEGHTRLSFWVGEDNSDDHLYGITRADWEAWRGRPTGPPAEVRLVPVTHDNHRRVARLRTHKTQEAFVATMADSFADALFPPVVDGLPLVPWMRAIEADGALAGFVMVAFTTERNPEPYLWRMLVDRMHQRRGIGGRALDLVEAELRARGDRSLVVSWVEGRGSPRPFYLARGFEPTGRIVDGETEARKQL